MQLKNWSYLTHQTFKITENRIKRNKVRMQRARWTCKQNRNKDNVFAASQLSKCWIGWIKQILELKGLGDLVCSLMLAFLISSCHCSSVQYLFSISLKVSSSWPETALIFNFSLMISSSSSSILRGMVYYGLKVGQYSFCNMFFALLHITIDEEVIPVVQLADVHLCILRSWIGLF